MSPVCLSFALVEETRVTSKSAAALLYLGETNNGGQGDNQTKRIKYDFVNGLTKNGRSFKKSVNEQLTAQCRVARFSLIQDG